MTEANERVTEALVRKWASALTLPGGGQPACDEQWPANATLKAALTRASKNGKGNGKPDFILYDPSDPDDLVIVIEAKAETKNHHRAEEEALWYASYLNKGRPVIAIAVSGQNAIELRWSFFLLRSGEKLPVSALKATRLKKPVSGDRYSEPTDWEGMKDAAHFAPIDEASLAKFAQTFHNFVRAEADISSNEKPLLVAGSLIALEDPGFTRQVQSGIATPDEWAAAIERVLVVKEVPHTRKANMLKYFDTLKGHKNLEREVVYAGVSRPVIHHIAQMLNDEIHPLMNRKSHHDVVGQFYSEFVKYTMSDQKDGIVLTPPHITKLFADLAKVDKSSVVYDPCAGTAGFLVAAMSRMLDGVTAEEADDIKKHRLIGIELDPRIFTLGSANMILRGDGKANFHQGSSVDDRDIEDATGVNRDGEQTVTDRLRPTVALANPPYSKGKSGNGQSELDFIEKTLRVLDREGTGIFIVPRSSATASKNKEVRRRILHSHRLDAVMTVPSELFMNVGTETCIMVFTAHVPHDQDPKRKTWFARWEDDGFKKFKGRRIEGDDWPVIRDRWEESFRDRTIETGFSTLHRVDADMDWLAVAYLETDYSKLTEQDFAKAIFDYTAYLGGESDGHA